MHRIHVTIQSGLLFSRILCRHDSLMNTKHHDTSFTTKLKFALYKYMAIKTSDSSNHCNQSLK